MAGHFDVVVPESEQFACNLVLVVEHGVYPVFYSDFPLFLLLLLSSLEAFLAFAQSKCPSQRLTMCALLSFFLMPIKCPGTPVVYWLLCFWALPIRCSRKASRTIPKKYFATIPIKSPDAWSVCSLHLYK
jgi:hypothetical protein